MILTLTLLFLIAIIDSFFRDSFNKKSKEAALIASVVALGLSLFSSTQSINLSGFIEYEEFNILKTLFIFVLFSSILFSSNKEDIFKKVVGVFLLASNNIEFQASFLLASLIVEEILFLKKSNHKVNALFILIVLCSLTGVFKGYGTGIMALIFSIKLLSKERGKVFVPSPTKAVFYSIVILVFSKNNPSIIFLIPLALVSTLYLYSFGRRLLSDNLETFSSYLTLSLLYLSILALVGLSQLFYFVGIILFIAELIRKNEKHESFHWNLFFMLFFFSPPFGIGYMSKSEIFESLISKSWFLLIAVSITILILQLFVILISTKSKLNFLDSLKKFKISADLKGSIFIIISILLSFLFLPDNWIDDYGNIFNSNFLPKAEVEIKRYGVGYYLFWAELVIWFSTIVLFYKTSPGFFEKIYFKSISLVSQKNSGSPKKLKKNIGPPLKDNKLTLRNTVSSLEIGRNRLPAQYFSLMMLMVMGLLLAGLI